MMGIDLQNLIMGLEKKLGLSVRSHIKYVENYIKAFYCSDDEIKTWVLEHQVCKPTHCKWFSVKPRSIQRGS